MEFRVWVTVLSPAAARLLVVGLVDRGYAVSPLNGAPGANQPVFQEGPLSTLAVLGLSHTKLFDFGENDEDDDDEDDDEDGVEEHEDNESEEAAIFHHGNLMAALVSKDVKEVLTELEASWFSIVVHEREGSCDWAKSHTFGATPPPAAKTNRFESIG